MPLHLWMISVPFYLRILSVPGGKKNRGTCVFASRMVLWLVLESCVWYVGSCFGAACDTSSRFFVSARTMKRHHHHSDSGRQRVCHTRKLFTKHEFQMHVPFTRPPPHGTPCICSPGGCADRHCAASFSASAKKRINVLHQCPNGILHSQNCQHPLRITRDRPPFAYNPASMLVRLGVFLLAAT